MERRKFMIGTGALAAGSAAALGSGAFSSVEAERGVTVEVADDNNAYLGLAAERDDIISEDGDGGQLSIDLGSQTTAEGGEGFNRNAVTEIDGVFRITNQGTQEVDVSIENDLDGVEFTLQEESLDVGDHTLVDVEVDTLNQSPDEEDGTVTISAGGFA